MEYGIYVPVEGQLIPINEWVQREDATSAKTLVLYTKYCCVEIDKLDFSHKAKWSLAQRALADIGKRSMTRHEFIDIYDARFMYDLDTAFRSIGGAPMTGFYWTCEEDLDPQYDSTIAFLGSFCAGYASHGAKSCFYRVRALADFHLIENNSEKRCVRQSIGG